MSDDYQPIPLNTPAMSAPQRSMYPDELTAPMRAELTNIGVEELMTPNDVQSKVASASGTSVVLINSVCGCAAGGARPGLAKAMQENEVKPDHFFTAFAGVHTDAVAAVRSLVPAPASSPSIIMFKDGKPVTMMHRSDIEIRDAAAVSDVLSAMFKEVCA